jgi:hypothetical protein
MELENKVSVANRQRSSSVTLRLKSDAIYKKIRNAVHQFNKHVQTFIINTRLLHTYSLHLFETEALIRVWAKRVKI